jgi:hypothetical protein
MKAKGGRDMRYEAPNAEIILLSADLLMASDENELAIDKLSSIFDF